MSINSAPDGPNQPINNLTVHSFTIPPYAITLLWGRASASWEQAIVIGIDGVRQPDQLGTYERTDFISIAAAGFPRTLTLAGWHKRGGPDGSQPWYASRGVRKGDSISWDDSGGDSDFNDYSVAVGFIESNIHLPVIKFKMLKSGSYTNRYEYPGAQVHSLKNGETTVAQALSAGGQFSTLYHAQLPCEEKEKLVSDIRGLLKPNKKEETHESKQQLLKLWTVAEQCLPRTLTAELSPMVQEKLFGQIEISKDITKQQKAGGY